MSRSNSPKRRRQDRPHNPKVTCADSGRKITYASRKRALTAMNRLRAPDANTASSPPTAVYRCQFCRGFHLTSRQRAGDK